ncbi:IS256 family transposase [Marinomonas mediterranea]|uniref:IS256 family transposase n=1 Tax=Marinomonas mediterranea TaxID=119864 RepID=UPI0002F4F316|nr:IS256 family transposase [Marinomonas mediterranea]WCN11163.1 IS256 family transposase [Marinomonas mediterranea]WCN19271.1 IS256 family transposase [Marinomonas mediterranea MMB-1]
MSGYGVGDSLSLQIPRDRLGGFKPTLLKVMKDQADSLNELCFELYAKGLTTRDIESITETIYGQHLSKSQISRITSSLSEAMQAFRERPLAEYYPIIYLDATFVKTRRERVSSEAYYIALAVLPDMTREVIGIYNAPTESASVWNEICVDLKNRGLKQSDLFVIDNLTGLDSTLETHFKAPIQKCILHLKRSILNKTKKQHRPEMVSDLSDIFQLENRDDTKDALLKRAKAISIKWRRYYPHLKRLEDADWLSYYATYLSFEYDIRNIIYTTNWIERLNKAFKRTLKIRNSMPSVESVLTLLSKVAIDMNSSTYRHPVSRFQKSHLFK